ncbi:MAG: EFR1 family ferrodoxin [Defluviitaleaceae bacterium]|nr:EFR1 family ferrodoxin [Defluviitaleaceae bacterium]
MVGIYFSGTGNTRYAVERFVSAVGGGECFSLEHSGVADELAKHDTVVFGFPVYYSNLPKIAKAFIAENKNAFAGKKVFIIATKGLFNALGVGYAARLFKDCGAQLIGSMQLIMPDNIRDLLIMEIIFTKNYRKVIAKAERKIAKSAEAFKSGKPLKSGLNPLNYLLGFFLRSLWFYPRTDEYITAPKIARDKCNGCGKCTELCPMRNITVADGKAVSGGKCTACYRCFSHCPTKALTILGRRVYGQYVFDNTL